jgi:hypothetical protein
MNRLRTTSCFAVYALIAAAFASWAEPAYAYRMLKNTSTGRVTSGSLVTCTDSGGFTHWTSAAIDWRHNTAGQGAGKATALQNAMQSWTNVPSAEYVLNYAGTTTSGWATDGTNTILWAIGNGCVTGNCLALTALVLQGGQVIVESDITFNADYTWRTDGMDFDTEAVAAHELGHSLGIHHTELSGAPTPTMVSTYFGTGGRTLEADDQAALQCSQYRYSPAPPGAPATPASLSIFNEHCYGLNTVSWGAVSGATHYELYRSTSSTFPTQTFEYSGTDTERIVNVSSNTYYRVRACNSSGCSNYRSGGPATYISGCL